MDGSKRGLAAVGIACGLMGGLAGCGGDESASTTTRAAGTTTVARAARDHVLEDFPTPDAIAADGTRLAMIRKSGGGGRALVVRESPNAHDRTVVRRLPVTVRRVAIGTDATGRPTAVLATAGTPDGDESAAASPTSGELYAVALTGPATVRKLPVTDAPGAETAPALRRGVLSFARTETVAGEKSVRLRVGSLTSPNSRVLWRGPASGPVTATAIGADGRVAFLTHSSPGGGDGVDPDNRWQLHVARPDRPTVSLEARRTGPSETYTYTDLTTDTAGTHVSVARSKTLGEDVRLRRYDLGTGRLDASKTIPLDTHAVPLGDQGFAAY